MLISNFTLLQKHTQIDHFKTLIVTSNSHKGLFRCKKQHRHRSKCVFQLNWISLTTDKAARPIVWLYEHNWLYELQTKIAQDNNNNNNKTLKACFWKHRSKGLSEVLIRMFTIATQRLMFVNISTVPLLEKVVWVVWRRHEMFLLILKNHRSYWEWITHVCFTMGSKYRRKDPLLLLFHCHFRYVLCTIFLIMQQTTEMTGDYIVIMDQLEGV